MKYCPRCGKNKRNTAFYRNPEHRDGLQSTCKKCKREYDRSTEAKEKRASSEVKEHRQLYANSPRGKYSTYKTGAKGRGYAFDLTFEQFMLFWQRPCSYCGDPIKTIGLDRIDNTKGYNTENVTPCCFECNEMKNNYSEPGFYARIKKIVQHKAL